MLLIHTRKEQFSHEEARLMGKFLTWQGIGHGFVQFSREALKHDSTGAKGVVMEDGKVVAVGFFALVAYAQTQGLIRI